MDCRHQASLSITNFQSLLKLMSIELVMPSNHLILCCSLLLLPSIFPSIRVLSSESLLHIMWPSIGPSASPSVLPMNIQDWSPLGLTGFISLLSKGLIRVFFNTITLFVDLCFHYHLFLGIFLLPLWIQSWIFIGRTDLKLKLQYFGHLMQKTDSFEKTLMLGKIEGRRRRGNRSCNGWMASLTRWTWVWASSGSWWWTAKPGVHGVAKK